ncbi:MAG: hypothetical protein PHW75_00515 [Patescibacteria group bacterium]|nr:hypothetical protein [Patescibacteria group bacterium]
MTVLAIFLAILLVILFIIYTTETEEKDEEIEILENRITSLEGDIVKLKKKFGRR